MVSLFITLVASSVLLNPINVELGEALVRFISMLELTFDKPFVLV